MTTAISIPDAERMSIISVCSAAEDFIKLYYEFVDKVRHKLSKLYLEDGILVWNGSSVTGNTSIQKYFEELPPSAHSVVCLDSQPISSKAVGEQQTMLVTTSGFVVYNKKRQPFQQTFVITSKDDKWKVVSDIFRFQNSTSQR